MKKLALTFVLGLSFSTVYARDCSQGIESHLQNAYNSVTTTQLVRETTTLINFRRLSVTKHNDSEDDYVVSFSLAKDLRNLGQRTEWVKKEYQTRYSGSVRVDSNTCRIIESQVGQE